MTNLPMVSERAAISIMTTNWSVYVYSIHQSIRKHKLCIGLGIGGGATGRHHRRRGPQDVASDTGQSLLIAFCDFISHVSAADSARNRGNSAAVAAADLAAQ